jgi:hypothetical protein
MNDRELKTDRETGWMHEMIHQFYKSMDIVKPLTRNGWSLHADKGAPLVAKLTIGHKRALRMGRGINEILIDLGKISNDERRLLDSMGVSRYEEPAVELDDPFVIQIPAEHLAAFRKAFRKNHADCVRRLSEGEDAQTMEKGIYTYDLANHLYRITRRMTPTPAYVMGQSGRR